MSEILKQKCGEENYKRLEALNNPALSGFVERFVEICRPDSVYVCNDSPEDEVLIKKLSVEKGEETALNTEGHTMHFDGINDQGRDPKNTKFLFEPGETPEGLNGIDRTEGEKEIIEKLTGIMEGRQMKVCFYALGPVDSPFYIPAVQLTDSNYVVHSENILYRKGYEGFKKAKPNTFFKVVHGTGPVNERMISSDVPNRRVYMDLKTETVYSCNTQYAGNTVGFKKLALRLAIQKASREGWLAEHMFVMGVNGPKGRKTYFAGAYPSMCGKTSTAMVEGETIVGDDLAYLRVIDGACHAVNVERGIFGIIQDISEQSDPLIYEVLKTEGDVIFGNVLNVDGEPRWLGDKKPEPEKGINFSGEWFKGKKDDAGKPIDYAHKNARYTISLEKLKNCDEKLHDPKGVELKGIIYGGRDSNTSVPVCESFGWEHGVITMGAALESETTAATIGSEGNRVFNIMSNLEFLSISMAKYLECYLEFGKKLKKQPVIFGANYFLRGNDGKWLNGVKDKRVWLKWMELKANKETGAIKTPVGAIPEYPVLKELFSKLLGIDYTMDNYNEQFMIRVDENIAKMDRIIKVYSGVKGTLAVVFEELEAQKKRLGELKASKGAYVTPDKF
ncbi:MAG TPA: phosphoenolpyruvate carboxykinase (GTP) [bacterium]|nr:phosphoenolpyruvate carboxykinase (GTP) [bacterium]